ncbi:acyl-CoA thioesterase [Sphingobium nicotianae]|uniref:Thioesterase family protein n=1 Tax=Sphingobium nicotianae TaxID=2782607 RepID=A0A9X1IRU7_9SPHN|nr:acyl-CoA thioesterase domain-containing protein [Sphingobium nicotianae]MBT2187737.1 thioesterase family protein [Sphingobium nicotianae]
MTDAAPDMDMLVRGLIHLLDVVPGEPAGHFAGVRKPGGVGRVFGGQVIGQALMAATKTVPDERLVHSLHCYFLRPGSEDHGIDYEVIADMEGRSFSNRRVVARQQEKVIYSMTASFHRDEPGPAHALAMPDVPPPEDLLNIRDLMRLHPLPAGPAMRRMASQPGPLDFRPVGAIQQGASLDNLEPDSLCWMRIGRGALGVSQAFQRAALAYMSDLLLLATAYRPHGLQIGGPEVISASIDHSLWFHGDVECGEWLLYAMDSPFGGGGRGFSRGNFFAQDGRLIASVAQEGLMRLKEG